MKTQRTVKPSLLSRVAANAKRKITDWAWGDEYHFNAIIGLVERRKKT